MELALAIAICLLVGFLAGFLFSRILWHVQDWWVTRNLRHAPDAGDGLTPEQLQEMMSLAIPDLDLDGRQYPL